MKITRVNTKNILEFQNIEMDELTVEDEEKAVEIAGTESGYPFMLALLHIACTFDGQKYPMEDLKRLKREDFLELARELTGKRQSNSEEISSNSQDTEISTNQL